MTLLALLIALAQQQPAQPTNGPQDQTVGVTQSSPKGANPDKSASSNTSDKAEPQSTEHNTDLQGGTTTKHAKHAKKKKTSKAQARSQRPLPEASPAPSAEKQDNAVETEDGQGKGRKQPKPLGEKSNQ